MTDRTLSEDNVGAFKVGEDIQNRSTSTTQPDPQQLAREAQPDALDATDDPAVGDNAGPMGDADAMTSGDTTDQMFDDSAVRPRGTGTQRRGEPEDIY